ncbi:MAG: DEAD/DEAH box helicase [Treponema sp.]|jgi:ATP-dependent Lhr-like helicase|nr:DEAD/DEAH box helicase [Treponema sp.]
MDPYSRLAPEIREYIYEKKWQSLHSVQEAAIEAVLDRNDHILIAAGTASGKTEAAFFPVLSQLIFDAEQKTGDTAGDAKVQSVQVLYIGPLKALINDQAERLDGLLGRLGIPLWRWHGDVDDNRKKKLLENPAGVLEITPESLEAILLKHSEKIKPLFCNLAFIILDEVHAFMGSERGDQILCQIKRIEDEAGPSPRRIGLSATLGNYREALVWLASHGGTSEGQDRQMGKSRCRKALLVEESGGGKKVRLALDYFNKMDPAAPGDGFFYRALYNQCRNMNPPGKCIIFTNSRLDAEETIGRLREMGREKGEEELFHIHHGSISTALREETEERLRRHEGPAVVAATATLELGIDIGELDRIIQIGPPLSAAGFVQRLGRSGRRSGRSEMYFTILEDPGEIRPPELRLPWPLLRTIAVIELYLKEKWTEGIEKRPLPFSLLCHQILSILGSLGEHTGADLARKVLSLPPFTNVTQEDFKLLLLSLLNNDIIEKTDKGLITGLWGERIISRYSFFSVFPDESEYRVSANGRELGRVNFLPPEGSSIILSGRYWVVDGIDYTKREIAVSPAESGGSRVWRGSGAGIHTKIVRRMKEILASGEDYAYLNGSARKRIADARSLAQRSGLLANNFISLERPASVSALGLPVQDCTDPSRGKRYSFLFFPWLGSRGMRTLLHILDIHENRTALCLVNLYRENEFCLRITSALDIPAFKIKLAEIISRPDIGGLPVDTEKIPLTGKYDYLLPQELLCKQYRANMLDLNELKGLMD